MHSFRFLIHYLLHRAGTITIPGNNPFIIDFKNHVLNPDVVYPAFGLMKDIKARLSQSTEPLEMTDLGAGTRLRQKKKTVGDMAGIASVSSRYGELLYRLASHYKPDMIIELGTALGISTMYMAMGNPMARVITVEGNPKLAHGASENFLANGLDNITIINKPFDEVLHLITAEKSNCTLVFIDGNHTHDATLRYFEAFNRHSVSTSIMVFDDINWSIGMRRAWKSITRSTVSGIIIDLFHMGIIFQHKGLKGQVFRLWY